MHKALLVPEIVEEVLDLVSDGNTLAAVARTTKAWTNPSLDRLWADLPSLFPLLNLLGGIRPVHQGPFLSGSKPTHWDFSRPLGPEDWQRLSRMSSRVKSLTHHDEYISPKGYKTPLSPQLLAHLATQRPANLVPALRKLTWHASSCSSLDHIFALLSPSLRSISLLIEPTLEDGWAISNCLKLLAVRSPNLTSFGFGCSLKPDSLLAPLIRLCRSKPTLETVLLPPGYWSQSLGNCLASLPRLTHLGHTLVTRSWEADEIIYYPFQLQPAWFQGLKSLTFDASLRDANGILRTTGILSQVESLGITSYPHDMFSVAELQDFVGTLVSRFPKLNQLRLNLQSRFYGDDLSFEDFSPLMTCSSLEALHITYNPPISLDANQITQMGRAWPNMESLEICQDVARPVHKAQAIPLDLLPIFASSFPNLGELGLYLDTHEPPKYGSFPRFAKLTKLKVGTSSIEAPKIPDVAAFLSEVISEDAELSHELGPAFISGLWEVDWMRDYLERENHWVEVKKFLAFLPQYKRSVIVRYAEEVSGKGDEKMRGS